jgi:2,4-dienoyl-CoA reductase-like NADH-dependent reductase (Old Yellow Enzyme family)/thioredoxin reductase
MPTSFPNLFSPLKIGGVEIKNRILSTGHDTSLPTDGTVNDALVAYQAARAKGGAGLIVSQVTGVHETARYTSHILMGTDDGCIAGFAKLTDAVHAHGAKLFVQLFHPGREIMESQDGTTPVAYAPSVSPSERFHVIPRAMSKAMIDEVVDGYGQTARRIHEAGADGVEIVASHGYLPAQFLNSAVNRRDDEYGGDFDNRLRFLREVIAAVRGAVGGGFVIGMRISGDEKDPEGLTEETSLEAIVALEGDLDYVNVIAGTSASLGGATHIVPPMLIETGYVAPFAAAVKAKTSLPVMVAGRINQPQIAETVVASGQADMCGMTRALICDPEMANKAAAGRSDDIRACIGCNQACIGHFHKGYPISCIQHPETGRELTYGALTPAVVRKKVMVVGGGPGGMKAAAVAARRGHDVTLYEASPRLGGQALLAQLLPGRSEFGGIVTNLSRELELAGADVVTKTAVDADLIAAQRPDAIIVATGGKPRWPHNAEIAEDAHVVDAWQVLREQANVGTSVVIADWRCDWIGVGLAEMLAESGCHVRLAVNGLHAGELLPFYVRDMAAARLHRLGVETITYARLYGADADTVYLQHTASEEPVIIEGVDTLVLAQGHEAEATLLDGLVGYGGEVTAIGDCVSARTAEEAVFEGLKAAWAL